MKTIRTTRYDIFYYYDIFSELTNSEITPFLPDRFNAWDSTALLNTIRTNISKSKYAKYLDEIDKKFLIKRLNGMTEKEWNKKYNKYCEITKIKNYKDGL